MNKSCEQCKHYRQKFLAMGMEEMCGFVHAPIKQERAAVNGSCGPTGKFFEKRTVFDKISDFFGWRGYVPRV